MTIPRLFGLNFRKRRLELGLTQENLAEKLNLHSTFISSIERGVKFPATDKIETICKFMGLRPYELFLEEGVDQVKDSSDLAITRFSSMLLKDLPEVIKDQIKEKQAEFFKNR